MNHLTVQWHITDKCNLRCKHCYQDSFKDKGFDLSILLSISEQSIALFESLKKKDNATLQFTITGGEPCSHPDLMPLLTYLSKHPIKPSLSILSNGSLIDEQWAQFFADIKINFVQLSIEGTKDIHDTIRGEGHFQKVLKTTELLTNAGIKVLWSFTVNNQNQDEFIKVARLAQQFNVYRFWSDRMIPTCQQDSLLTLDAKQSLAYFKQMHLAKQEIESNPDNETEIAMLRALQFQIGGNQPYYCKAGGELITIMPNGIVFPCRRMPIEVGNMLETPLTKIYQHPIMQELRQFSAPQECGNCLYRTNCKGGLRCLSYAVHQTLFRADPGCSYLNKE